jgi:hypothetical protein
MAQYGWETPAFAAASRCVRPAAVRAEVMRVANDLRDMGSPKSDKLDFTLRAKVTNWILPRVRDGGIFGKYPCPLSLDTEPVM